MTASQKGIIIFAVVQLLGVCRGVSAMPSVCAAQQPEQHEELTDVRTGVETDRVWVEVKYQGLTFRKFTRRDGAAVIELRQGTDTVTLSIAESSVTVLRTGGGKAGSARDAEQVITLLASSPAVMHARNLLSVLERKTSLTAVELSVSGALSVVAALSGDRLAPQRLRERFVPRQAGGYKPIRLGSCWTDYTTEVMAASDDLSMCQMEATEGSVFLETFRLRSCDVIWFLRAESAWFEYLSCVSPLAVIKG